MLDPISSASPFAQRSVEQSLSQLAGPAAESLGALPANGSDAELREAFDDFVGQTFFGTLLKELRKSEHGAAYLNGGQAEKVFKGQLDQVLVERMTDASAETMTGPMFDLMMANRVR